MKIILIYRRNRKAYRPASPTDRELPGATTALECAFAMRKGAMTINANIYVLFILLLMIVVGVLAWRLAWRKSRHPVLVTVPRCALLCLAPPFAPAGAAHSGAVAGHARRSGCQANPSPLGRSNRKAPCGALSCLQRMNSQASGLVQPLHPVLGAGALGPAQAQGASGLSARPASRGLTMSMPGAVHAPVGSLAGHFQLGH